MFHKPESRGFTRFLRQQTPEQTRNIEHAFVSECCRGIFGTGTNYASRSNPLCLPCVPNRRELSVRFHPGRLARILLISTASLRLMSAISRFRHSHQISAAHTLSRGTVSTPVADPDQYIRRAGSSSASCSSARSSFDRNCFFLTNRQVR